MLALIQWLGGLRSSTTRITVDLDTSGQTRFSTNAVGQLLILHFSFNWGAKKITWDLIAGCKDNGANVRC